MGDNDDITAKGQEFEKQVGIEKYRLGDQQRYSENLTLQMQQWKNMHGKMVKDTSAVETAPRYMNATQNSTNRAKTAIAFK